MSESTPLPNQPKAPGNATPPPLGAPASPHIPQPPKPAHSAENAPGQPPYSGQPGNYPQPGGDSKPQSNTIRIVIIIGVVVIVLAALGIGGFILFNQLNKPEKVELVDENFNDNTYEVEHKAPASDAAEASEKQPAPKKTKAASNSVYDWSNGKQVLSGDFIWEGSRYPFEITFNYYDGDISNVTFEAMGYGGVSSVSYGSVSADGSTLTFKGKASGTSLNITASWDSSSQTFSGSMIRGDHYGSCEMRP